MKKKRQRKKQGERQRKKSILVKLNSIGEKHTPYAREQCSFKIDIIHQFPEHHIPFDVFSAVTNRDGLVEPNLKTFYKISFFRTIQKLTKVTKIRKSDAL